MTPKQFSGSRLVINNQQFQAVIPLYRFMK
jgi:hypothetical protein